MQLNRKSLHKAGTPNSCISSESIDEKWTDLKDNKKTYMSEHCQRLAGSSLENLNYKMLLQWCGLCLHFHCSPQILRQKMRLFGVGGALMTVEAEANPPWKTSPSVRVVGGYIDINWKMNSDLTDSEHGGKKLCVLELMEYISQPQRTSRVPWVSHWEKLKGIPFRICDPEPSSSSAWSSTSLLTETVIWPHLSLQTYWLSPHTLHSVHQLLSAASSFQNSPSHLTLLTLNPCYSACSTVPLFFCGLTYSKLRWVIASLGRSLNETGLRAPPLCFHSTSCSTAACKAIVIPVC